ncbi:MAG: energy-coupled thiamine transporter ThiT [Firmicutes bacterium]|nr:energy-coupled thiamine transporter ThiT [Bacillota bacterium]
METKMLTEIGVTAALAFVLSLIRLYRRPNGGSITLEMVPLFYLAFRSGWKPAAWAGAVLGLLNLLGDAYVIHPLQLLLDYPLPFAVLGIAGVFSARPILGIVVASVGRLVIHTLAGVIFWASYAPEGQNVWAYSIGYNATFLVPQLVLTIIIMLVIMRTGLWSKERSE